MEEIVIVIQFIVTTIVLRAGAIVLALYYIEFNHPKITEFDNKKYMNKYVLLASIPFIQMFVVLFIFYKILLTLVKKFLLMNYFKLIRR